MKRFNASDAVGLAELYDDDEVNHEVANDPVSGKAAIRTMFEAEYRLYCQSDVGSEVDAGCLWCASIKSISNIFIYMLKYCHGQIKRQML